MFHTSRLRQIAIHASTFASSCSTGRILLNMSSIDMKRNEPLRVVTTGDHTLSSDPCGCTRPPTWAMLLSPDSSFFVAATSFPFAYQMIPNSSHRSNAPSFKSTPSIHLLWLRLVFPSLSQQRLSSPGLETSKTWMKRSIDNPPQPTLDPVGSNFTTSGEIGSSRSEL
jgi:hypothetical protein